jgi:hypothetical protein
MSELERAKTTQVARKQSHSDENIANSRSRLTGPAIRMKIILLVDQPHLPSKSYVSTHPWTFPSTNQKWVSAFLVEN